MISPSAWPVATGCGSLESRSKASGKAGSGAPPNSPSSPSSNSSRRLAASASANCSRPSASGSPGRVRVRTQLSHSAPASRTAQLHAASSAFAQRRRGGSSATSVRGSHAKASSVSHVRQREFSKNTIAVQTGHVNARIGALPTRGWRRAASEAHDAARAASTASRGCPPVEIGPDRDPERPRAAHERARLAPDLDLRRIDVAAAVLERAGTPVAGRDEEPDPRQCGQQRRRIVLPPDVAVVLRIAPDGVRVVGVAREQAEPDVGRAQWVQDAGERRRGAERVRPPRGVVDRAEPAHREPGDRPPGAGAEPPLEDPRQLAQVEVLPGRPVEPVRVEADVPALGHHDQHVAQLRQLLDVGRAGPAVVGVAAPVQQVEDGPAPAGPGPPAVRREQADPGGAPECPRAHGEVELARRHAVLRDDGVGPARGGRRRRRARRHRSRRGRRTAGA